LADSPSCIVSDDEDPSMQMFQMMKAMGQTANLPALKPILEVNPDHEIVKKLLASKDEGLVADASWLLLEQALLVGGVPLEDPAAFVQRLNRVLNKAV
jgi:molecular chaperone HtpG